MLNFYARNFSAVSSINIDIVSNLREYVGYVKVSEYYSVKYKISDHRNSQSRSEGWAHHLYIEVKFGPVGWMIVLIDLDMRDPQMDWLGKRIRSVRAESQTVFCSAWSGEKKHDIIDVEKEGCR